MKIKNVVLTNFIQQKSETTIIPFPLILASKYSSGLTYSEKLTIRIKDCSKLAFVLLHSINIMISHDFANNRDAQGKCTRKKTRMCEQLQAILM